MHLSVLLLTSTIYFLDAISFGKVHLVIDSTQHLSIYPCLMNTKPNWRWHKLSELYAHIAYQETLTLYLEIERIKRQRKEDYLKRLLGYSCIYYFKLQRRRQFEWPCHSFQGCIDITILSSSHFIEARLEWIELNIYQYVRGINHLW